MAILDRIPDLSVIADASANVQSNLGTLFNALQRLDTQASGSPIGVVVGVFNGLQTRLDIDASPRPVA